MDEELAKIITNAELDDAGKQEAIKSLVSKEYVPAKVHSEEVKKIKGTLENVQTEFNSFKQTKMSEEEKKQEEIRVAQEIAEKKDLLLSEMVAKNVFSEAGFKKTEYEKLLGSVVKADYAETEKSAKIMCEVLQQQREAIQKEVQESLIKGSPKPPSGGIAGEGSASEIEKLQKLYSEASGKGNYSEMAYYTRLIQEAMTKKV